MRLELDHPEGFACDPEDLVLEVESRGCKKRAKRFPAARALLHWGFHVLSAQLVKVHVHLEDKSVDVSIVQAGAVFHPSACGTLRPALLRMSSGTLPTIWVELRPNQDDLRSVCGTADVVPGLESGRSSYNLGIQPPTSHA